MTQAHDLRRVIGLAGGTALIVGITIGSGIFRTPPTIAGLVPAGVAVLPGALTPSEVFEAFRLGGDMVKVFPVQARAG